MNILISGSSGLVGTALIAELSSEHRIFRLVRKKDDSNPDTVFWDIASETIEQEKLSQIDAVVHLAGENIAGGRWTEERKAAIRSSRVLGTRFLCEQLARQEKPVGIFISASAIGIYGDRPNEVLQESSAAGSGFLADVVRDWEAASTILEERGTRVVHTRFGIILSPDGGALKKMLTPFRLGVGGKIGPGSQYMSWVTLADTIRAIVHCLNSQTLSGPVNVVAPNPVTNEEFTKTLASTLARPSILPLPAFAARLILGEMADELLLASTNVEATKLLQSGFTFNQEHLPKALKTVLSTTL